MAKKSLKKPERLQKADALRLKETDRAKRSKAFEIALAAVESIGKPEKAKH